MKSMNPMLVSLPTQSRLAIHQWPNKAGSDAAKLLFMTVHIGSRPVSRA